VTYEARAAASESPSTAMPAPIGKTSIYLKGADAFGFGIGGGTTPFQSHESEEGEKHYGHG